MLQDINEEMLRKLLSGIEKALLTSNKLREELRELEGAMKKDPENISLQVKSIQGINFAEGYSKAVHDILIGYHEE